MAPTDAAFGRITPAEALVLEQLRQGLSNKAIAANLVLSRRTVESHVSSLLAKTGCRSRSQLLLWTLEVERTAGDTMPADGRAAPVLRPRSPA